MSYGGSPYDDDPALRQQPPIVPPEAEGPAAPDAIDPMMASLPPAPPPGTIQDPDAWPPPVPSEAPGMVPPPATGPANPNPASPGQGAGLSPSGSPIDLHRAAEEMGRANETADKARREYQQAQVDEEQAKAPEVHAAAEAAQQRVDHMQAANDQENAIRQRYDALETAAQGEHQRTLDAFRKFKFKDYWADKPMATRAASALAVALGGFGAGLTKTPNYALQILDKQMDDDHSLQVANLHQLSDEEVMARTKIGDIQTARSKALADVTAADAQKDRLIAAQLEAAAARSQDANYQQHVGTFAKKLQVEAAEKDVAARKMYFDAAAKASAYEDLAAQRRSLAHLNDVKAAHGGSLRHGAGAGGGGGAVGGDAAAELSRRIEAGKDGKPLSETEMIQAANELHIPLEAKAGHVSLKTIRGSVAFNADVAAKANRAGQGQERIDLRKLQQWQQQEGMPKVIATHDQLANLEKKVNDPNVDPATVALSLMEFDKAAKGGTATKGSYDVLMDHLGGTRSKVEGWFQHGYNGGLGPDQMTTIRKAIGAAVRASNEEAKTKAQSFDDRFGRNPEANSQYDSIFRRFGMSRGGGAGTGGGSDMVTIRNAKTGETKQVTREEAKRMGALK